MKKKINGIFFERKSMLQGTGGTSREKINDIHYHCATQDHGNIALEVVNFEGNRTGVVTETIEFSDFKKRFKPCSYHDCAFKLKDMEPEERKKEQTILRGKAFLEREDYTNAEKEFLGVLGQDEKHVKAQYCLGMTYHEKGNREKAREVFERLLETDALYKKETKALFKECGVYLRKNKFYKQAAQKYRKAIKIHPNDSDHYYGLARVYGSVKEYDKAIKCLNKSLSLKPDCPKASKFLAHIQKAKSG